VDVAKAGGKVRVVVESSSVVAQGSADKREDAAPGEAEPAKDAAEPPPPAPATAAPIEGYDAAESGTELEAAPLEDGADSEEAPANYSSQRASNAAEVESKRGCGCRVVGSPMSGRAPLALGLGLAGLWLVRRRRQHAASAVRPHG
jgi:MYXO-CTERM domain-containing protein